MGASYGLFVIVLLLYRAYAGEQSEAVALLNNTFHWILGAAALGFLATLLAPQRRFWAVYALPGVIAFVWWYGDLFLPRFPPPATETEFTVVTFNMNGQRPILPKLDVIHALDADLLALQEATIIQTHIGNDERLADRYAYSLVIDQLALYSRFPIDESTFGFIGGDPEEFAQVWGFRVDVTIDARPVSVYVLHPERPFLNLRPLYFEDGVRNAVLTDAADDIAANENPVILLCDCNTGAQTDDYAALDAHLIDAWQQAGWGFGLTAPADPTDTPIPLLRSDIIWHSHDFVTQRIQVWGDSGGGDHYPVVATVGLRE